MRTATGLSGHIARQKNQVEFGNQWRRLVIDCALLMRKVHWLLLANAMTTTVNAMRPAALVTGSTDGIGITTAKHLAAKGFDVLIHGRDEKRIERAESMVRSFASKHNSEAQIFALPPCDLSSIDGSVKLAQSVAKVCEDKDLALTILMNNAGVFSEDHVVTPEGLELTFAVNVVAPFVITSLLLPLLLKQKSRIVIASSISQCGSIRNWDDLAYSTRPYSAHAAYSESKLLDAMLTIETAARFQAAGIGSDRITCNCLDPGTVNTKMLYAGWGPCGVDVEDALDQTWLCTAKEVEDTTGAYFVYQNQRKAASSAYDKAQRDRMWSILANLAPEAAAMWNFSW
jgi:NAD(P)-dependent dehydrogenase (short-subunit alcohol dehydrogenase family)